MDQQKRIIYVPTGHAPESEYRNFLIHPVRAFWGDGTPEWNKYEYDFSFYLYRIELTNSIADADAVFLPLALNYYLQSNKIQLVNDLCKFCIEYNKICYIWLEGDLEVNLEFSNSVILKNSSSHSRTSNAEIIRPGDVKTDLLHAHFNGKVDPVRYEDKPSIGFDGLAKYPSWRLIALVLKNFTFTLKSIIFSDPFIPPPVIPLLVKRKKILKRFRQSIQVLSDFNERDSFAAGTRGNDPATRMEFLENLRRNPYALCIRGSANYSLRFFEALCLGRIPVLIDTDCVLPCEDEIDWPSLIPIIPYNNYKQASDLLLDFHQQLGPEGLIIRQIECRKIYETFLSREGFFDYVIKKINSNS